MVENIPLKKVTTHKHTLAAEPAICEDCGASSHDYFIIVLDGDKKERLVCNACLFDSGIYEYNDSFLFIDKIDRHKKVKNSLGKTIKTAIYDIHQEYHVF